MRPPACRGLRPEGKSENEILKVEFGSVVVPEGRDYAAAGMRKGEKGIGKSDPSSSDKAELCRGKHVEVGKGSLP